MKNPKCETKIDKDKRGRTKNEDKNFLNLRNYGSSEKLKADFRTMP